MRVVNRALQGLREHMGAQWLSIGTIALSLFCLAVAVIGIENADAISARWGAPVQMTVYLADGASAADIEALRTALSGLPDVADVHYVSPADAREMLSRGAGDHVLSNAATDLFPATLEVQLATRAVSVERVQTLADHVRRLPTVTDVETYRGLTEQMHSMLAGGRAVALIIALLALVCAIAVVSNTVRLTLSARMREVEVLRLVGASPRYVRGPLLLEGAFVGALGAACALAAVAVVFLWFREHYAVAFGDWLGVQPSFLGAPWTATFVLVGGALGACGSGWAMRRWMQV